MHAIPITVIKGVGEKLASKLAQRGIYTLEDCLFHLPYRYQDRTAQTAIRHLRADEHAVIDAEIIAANVQPGPRKTLSVRVCDLSGELLLRFFHIYPQQVGQFESGLRVRCFGQVRRGRQGLEMIHPDYQLHDGQSNLPVEEALTPIYHTTQGINQRLMQQITEKALDYASQLKAISTDDVETRKALAYIHRPPADADVPTLLQGRHPYQRLLAMQELIAHQCIYLKLGEQYRKKLAPACKQAAPACLLPFELTRAQQKVINEIAADLACEQPMLRLVQGDVGSGKTLVALLSAFRVVQNGYQVALMAPTALLAEQHARNAISLAEQLNIQCVLLTGSHKGRVRQEKLAQIASHQAQLIIGTHALFQDGVDYHQLGLIIIDEQHRFGVAQRYALNAKGAQPHQLVMTATPIPRTLSMTAYADLDVSIIDELPPGRKPVTTVAMSAAQRDALITRLKAVCASGKQVYWVCTLIETSDVLQAQAASETYEQLKETCPDLKIGLVHGRLSAVEKGAIMEGFKANEIQLLVATTVIEVGVDVPNASFMIIENPERLGLSQLHQLRGRVGRGCDESFCVLMYQAPLGRVAKQRLDLMRQSNDGFIIAQADLKQRGPGEFLGTRQTGLASLKIADLIRDEDLIPKAMAQAKALLTQDKARAERLIARYIADKAKYVQA